MPFNPRIVLGVEQAIWIASLLKALYSRHVRSRRELAGWISSFLSRIGEEETRMLGFPAPSRL